MRVGLWLVYILVVSAMTLFVLSRRKKDDDE